MAGPRRLGMGGRLVVDLMMNASPWRYCRWLVLAPHPDDETLGAGALIAQASGTGRLAGVAYLTDGSASHDPGSVSPRRLAARRKAEAAGALFRLTGTRKTHHVHLDWKDAAPFEAGEPQFNRAARLLAAFCRRLRVDAIAVTALAEPHCDHAAAAHLAQAVSAASKRSLMVAEYYVWASPPNRRAGQALRTSPMPIGKRRHALRAHRSQLTGACGSGFRLPKERLNMPSIDILHLQRRS